MVDESDAGWEHFERHGVAFDYPDAWELNEVPQEDSGVLLTLGADDSCFWSVRILPECPAPADVVESCVAGFRDEYEDLDVYRVEGRLAEMPSVGRDLEFSCFELMNTAALRCVRCAEFTLLVWWQGTDHELQSLRSVLERITSTVRILSLN